MADQEKLQTITPYQDTSKSKKEQVAEMFDNIAPSYDFLNHFLSMGIDKIWRKKAINILKKDQPSLILDVATGTGDFAFETFNQVQPKQITGIDISQEMLHIGRQKAQKKGMKETVIFEQGDCENLRFESNTFDAVTVAFGVRNFENTLAGLAEMHRVIKPGAKAVILEFSKPKNFLIKTGFNIYFRYICPLIGKIVSKDNRAYTYLHDSVQVFPEGNDFKILMEKAGFNNCKWRALTFGICSLYIGEKQ